MRIFVYCSEKEVLHYYRNLRGHSRGDAIVRCVQTVRLSMFVLILSKAVTFFLAKPLNACIECTMYIYGGKIDTF